MAEPSALHTLIDAARAPVAEWPARYPGRRAMGYVCSYVPEEIIHAAGLSPVRLRGSATPLRHADAHIQSFTCSLCRSTLDQALGGDLGFLAGAAFAHTCDTMQAEADLWRMNAPESLAVEVVMQPVALGSPAARPYLRAELERFRQRMAAVAGRLVTDDDLRASIALCDETRRMVQALRRQRGRMSTASFFAVLDAAQVMPREQLNLLLAELLREMEAAGPTPEAEASPRLYLAGAVLDEPRLAELIDEAGARVVGDDLCSGSRHFYGQVGSVGDPITALTNYYLNRPPCPSKLQPGHNPGSYLVEQSRQVGAGGVVFVLEKFCEPHAFDYAMARPALDEAGLPHMVLEMEQMPSLEGLRTRLQAFVEML